MADLEQRIPMPPPFRREGRNAEEPIMIGSSDDEDEGPGRPPGGPGRGTIAEQRARLHNNRTGTPIPRALEQGLRIMSPPPPLPQPGLHPWHRRPDWPHALHVHNAQSIHQRLLQRSPDAWRRILAHDGVGRLLNMMFPGMGDAQQPQAQQRQPEPEYDVRMTHSRAKPRIGFSFDFAPDEDEENAAESTKAPAVRTRTTIVIPDSPPLEPVDRKGKGRAKTPLDVEEILDLESDEWAASSSGPSTSASASTSVASPGSSRSRKKRAVETIEILSDDELEPESPSKEPPVLVCASCRRPLRMGGDRLWALRCGHMIDSRCYRKLGERPVVDEPVPVPIPEPEPEPEQSRPTKRRRISGGRGKRKTKVEAAPAPVAPAVVEPYQAETLEWCCPVARCGRVHWSERMVNGVKSVWQPMKDTGAVGVFV